MTLPVKMSDGSIGTMELPALMPFDVLEYLINVCGLRLDDKVLASFWGHLDKVGDEWSKSTADYRRGVPGQVWPLGLYGDEAVVGLINNPFLKVVGLFLSVPLYRPSSTRLSRYLLFAVESDKIVSFPETVFPVLRAIVVSMNRLSETGIGSTYFLCSEIRGDQGFFKHILRHKSWWKDSFICFRCRANIKSGRSNYLRYDGWTNTRHTLESFFETELTTLPLCA